MKNADLPQELQTHIAALRSLPDRESCLREAYRILTEKYRGGRLETIMRLPAIFQNEPSMLWKKNGFLHCTNLTELLQFPMTSPGKLAA